MKIKTKIVEILIYTPYINYIIIIIIVVCKQKVYFSFATVVFVVPTGPKGLELLANENKG